jgi:hypothetical protein
MADKELVENALEVYKKRKETVKKISKDTSSRLRENEDQFESVSFGRKNDVKTLNGFKQIIDSPESDEFLVATIKKYKSKDNFISTTEALKIIGYQKEIRDEKVSQVIDYTSDLKDTIFAFYLETADRVDNLIKNRSVITKGLKPKDFYKAKELRRLVSLFPETASDIDVNDDLESPSNPAYKVLNLLKQF